MSTKSRRSAPCALESRILTIRSQKVILDRDLAVLYGVPTKVFNQAVKRNINRFPTDFMFRLTEAEYGNLRSRSVTSKSAVFSSQAADTRHGGRRYLPYAFTEHGAVMAAIIFRSDRVESEQRVGNLFRARSFVDQR